jgi:hypothetical protein
MSKSKGLLGIIQDAKFDAVVAIYNYIKKYGVTSGRLSDGTEMGLKMEFKDHATVSALIDGEWKDIATSLTAEHVVDLLGNIEEDLNLE